MKVRIIIILSSLISAIVFLSSGYGLWEKKLVVKGHIVVSRPEFEVKVIPKDVPLKEVTEPSDSAVEPVDPPDSAVEPVGPPDSVVEPVEPKVPVVEPVEPKDQVGSGEEDKGKTDQKGPGNSEGDTNTVDSGSESTNSSDKQPSIKEPEGEAAKQEPAANADSSASTTVHSNDETNTSIDVKSN